MSGVKIERKAGMSRQEAAQFLADLAQQLRGKGRVTIGLADSTVELDVPEQLRLEAEIEVDGDEVEVEIELKWPTAARPQSDG
ncbi:amphi-Trp domain-containing protein [Blastococcus sp. URHD0036]|uniref:amphi-Trp domain-containing protein n=1 Tax=Blastococcus sp. URHD0036 TaxID=1380356 RepID=UPI00068D8D53|nr:amphi-Trp domain-containing protein [Blastococcus sp. URHD0036]